MVRRDKPGQLPLSEPHVRPVGIQVTHLVTGMVSKEAVVFIPSSLLGGTCCCLTSLQVRCQAQSSTPSRNLTSVKRSLFPKDETALCLYAQAHFIAEMRSLEELVLLL